MALFSKAPVFVLIATLLLAANFSGHMFSSLPLKRFLNNEFPSEAHMITRLAYNSEGSTQDHSGFMLYSPVVEELFLAADKEPYKDIRQTINNNPKDIVIYQSHVGLQDEMLYPVWKMLFKLRDNVLEKAREGSRWQKRMQSYDLYYIVKITQAFVALFNGLIIALILLWVFKQFSIKTAYIALALVLVLMADLTFFGRSMWWIMGVWFLPFLIMSMSYLMARGQPLRTAPLLLASILAGLGLTLKTSLGYEFASTIMVSAVVPVTFYAMLNKWSFKSWFIQCLPVGIFQLAGLALTFWLHAQALESGGWDPIALLKETFEGRAHGNGHFDALEDLVGDSVNSSVLGVWASYIFGYKNMGLPQFILMSPLLFWLWTRRKDWKTGFTKVAEEKALLTGIALGGLGALSMFTILKGHAYIHSYDVAAWSIPMNLLLMVFYARWIEKRFSS